MIPGNASTEAFMIDQNLCCSEGSIAFAMTEGLSGRVPGS